MDVVYPLAPQSKGRDDFELRYSLRSLNRQPWAGKVFVIGYKPPWLRNVVHIEYPDQWHYIFKDKNIIKKMLRACADDRVSDPFVANSDDQYWLRAVEPGEMLIPPREHPSQMELDRTSAAQRPGRAWRSQWVKRQHETVTYLRKQGKSEITFDGHVPYLIHKQRYLRTMAGIPWEMGIGFLIVVYHGWNWEELGAGRRVEERDGVLVRIKTDLSRRQIEEAAAGALFLNHNNKALSAGMREFLQKRFPEPSRWE